MVLKCADIGHLAAGLHTHKRWALQLEEEFFRQVCACLGLGMESAPGLAACLTQTNPLFSLSLL